MTTSPPTDRVVAIVNLLASTELSATRTVSGIAAELGLNRATTTAVLSALESAGWVSRGEDLAYSVGAGLIGMGAAVRRSLPLPASTAQYLDALVAAVGGGVTLSLVESGSLTVLAARNGHGRRTPGMSVGRRIPLIAPAGAAVMPWRGAAERAVWLDNAPAGQRDSINTLLELVAESGVALWRPEGEGADLLDVLAELLDVADEQLLRPRLRHRVLAQLPRLAGRPYTRAELHSDDALPISYLAAPVFDHDGVARFEVQLGPLRAAVTRADRNRYIAALLETSRSLSGVPS